MRYNIAYYLFLLYTLVIIKPVIPIVKDAFSHSFALAKHLATVHAKYGSHHLDKELDNESSDNGKKGNSVKTEEGSEVYIPSSECRFHFHRDRFTNFPLLIPPSIEAIFLSIQAPPPKFS